MNIIDLFLDKHVRIEAFGYSISGTLIQYQESNRYSRYGHVPNVLIIQGKSGRQILGGWQTIKVS